MKKKTALFYLKALLAAAAFCLLCSPNKAYAEEDVIKDNKNGTVSITFNNKEETTMLVLCENTTTGANTERYYYKLASGKNIVNVPLTEGAGTYKIRIAQLRSDEKAVVLMTGEVELEEDNSEKAFEIPTMAVDYGISDKFIKKAKTLTKKCTSDNERIKKIYNYIVRNYSYDYELRTVKVETKYYLPNNTATFDRKLGICYDISCLMAAMLRSVGVESRVVTGHTPNVKEYHAWNQVYDSDNDLWYTIDATYDMCKYKSGKIMTMVKKDTEYCDIVYTY